MNRLPLEIENKIWNMYWMDIFTREVISVLNDYERQMEKMIFFLKKHVYLHYCFNEKYIESCFSKVSVSYKRICAYCMCAGVPYMNYYCLLRFINLGN